MRSLVAAAASLGPAMAWAHEAGSAAALPGNWRAAPWLLALLAATAILHAVGTLRLWRRAGAGRGLTYGAAIRFWTGWAVLCIALLSPIDALGAERFSVHMVQHELLMVVAAPLLATGRPLEAWTWALPSAWRRGLGVLAGQLRGAVAWVAHPLGAWLAHALALWLWHVPAFFEASLAHPWVHELQHASFLGTALLLWWSVLGRGTRGAGAMGLGSIFTTMLHSGALGALLTFAPSVWYAPYRDAAGPAFAALQDQQLGGLVMWVPGGLAYLIAGLAIVASWLRSSPAGASSGAGETRARALAVPAHPE